MAYGDRVPSEDFETLAAAGNSSASGVYEYNGIVYISDVTDDKVYAYDLITKAHLPNSDIDFDSDNTNPQGLDGDGTTIWSIDRVDDKLYAYRLSDGARDASKDMVPASPGANYALLDSYSDGITRWFLWDTNAFPNVTRVQAYNVNSDGVITTRDNTRDFMRSSTNVLPSSICGNATHLFIGGTSGYSSMRAYSKLNLTADTDFDIPLDFGFNRSRGAWVTGLYMFTTDVDTPVLVAYSASTVVTPAAPSTPGGLSAAPDDSQITLSWHPESTASAYDIRYRESGSSDQYVMASDITTTGTLIDMLDNAVTYEFQVRAKNSGGESDWGPTPALEASPDADSVVVPPIIPPPQAPPPIPGMLVGTARDKQVALVWIEAPRAETYDLRYRRTTLPQGAVEEWAVLTDITAEAKVVEGLLNDVSYDFAVRAVNVFGESLWSEPISVTPIPSTIVPDRPDNLMVTADNAQVDVEWDLVTGAQYYDLQYKLNSDSDYTRIRFYASDLPVTIDRLENGSVYNFRVRAGNSAGNSLYSSVVNATPAGSTVSPDRPSNLRVVRNLDSSDQVDISWFDPNGSGRVEIEYRKDSEINWTNTGQLTNQYPPYTLTVDINVRYRFRIRAWNTTDNSAWSPEADYILLAATSVRGVQRERAIIIKFEHDARGICSGGRIITLDDVEKYGSFRGLTFEPWIQISSDLGSDAIAQHSITPSVQIKIPLDDIPDWVENRTVGEDIIAAYIEKFSVNDEWELTDYGYIGVLDRFNQHAENFNFTFISPLERVTKEDPNLWSDFAHQSLYEGDLWFSDLTGLSLRGPYVRFP